MQYINAENHQNKFYMGNKQRLIIWVVFIAISIVFAFAKDGIRETWWMLMIFLLIPVIYETILYFKMKKK